MNAAPVQERDVGKKRPAEPEPSSWLDKPKKPVVAQVRGSVEFKKWLARLSKKDHRPVADIFEIAVTDYAAKIGFEPPPER